MKEQKGSTIFVGNIDFEVPESEIIKELETIGRVVNFRLIYDKNTGKSKGYGFCEYESPQIAQTALKTLRIKFNGRPVKINPSDYNSTTQQNTEQPTIAKKINPSDYFKLESNLEGIKLCLESFDKTYLTKFLLLLKSLIIQEEFEFIKICEDNPSFPFLLVQTLLNLNLIKYSEAKKIIKESLSIPGNAKLLKERIKEVNFNKEIILNDVIKEKFISLYDIFEDE